jgi:glycolate dehydrogenase FAD-linked subunit
MPKVTCALPLEIQRLKELSAQSVQIPCSKADRGCSYRNRGGEAGRAPSIRLSCAILDSRIGRDERLCQVESSMAHASGRGSAGPSAIAQQLIRMVGEEAVLWRVEDRLLYEYDGLSSRRVPDAVVFPMTTEDVIEIVKLARKEHVPVIARGAGTGLSGGAVVTEGGIVVSFARMRKILEIDIPNQRARVQPGVVNFDLSLAVADAGYYFAPDPSSQKACTIGGNVAENSGGPHTLASGVTTNHVLGLELVLDDGRVVRTGGKIWDRPGYDLTGFIVGSEGTLGLVTEITVRLTKKPEAAKTLLSIYDRVLDATRTVAAITAGGITPAALEMMDGITLRAIEDATHAGYPMDSAAVLLIEVEGLREAVEEEADAVETICRNHSAREVRRARSEEERALLWRGRKNAFGALGRISPNFYVQDGVIPRTRLPEMLEFIAAIGEKHGLLIGNIFHAGDGNLHPLLMFDARDPKQSAKVLVAASEIMSRCAELGGSITGEHGVGIEKNELMPLIFSPEDLRMMEKLKNIFNPQGFFNPGKLLPTGKMCGELRIQVGGGA